MCSPSRSTSAPPSRSRRTRRRTRPGARARCPRRRRSRPRAGRSDGARRATATRTAGIDCRSLSSMGATLTRRGLQVEEGALAVEPAAVAGERARGADHAVARDDHRERVAAVGGAHRAAGAAGGRPRRRSPSSVAVPPYGIADTAAQTWRWNAVPRGGQREVELAQLAGEVGAQLVGRVEEQGVGRGAAVSPPNLTPLSPSAFRSSRSVPMGVSTRGYRRPSRSTAGPCSASWRRGRWRGWRRSRAGSYRRSVSLKNGGGRRVRETRGGRRAGGAGSGATRPTRTRRSSGCAACSTSTPTRPRSRRCSGPIRCSRRLCRSGPGSALPGRDGRLRAGGPGDRGAAGVGGGRADGARPAGAGTREEAGEGFRRDVLAEADPGGFPFPRARGAALVEVARLVAAGELRLDRS